MRAVFNNTDYEIEVAARRAGLNVRSELTNSKMEDVSVFGRNAVGSTHAIMRLIGALADDGQDTLVSVEG